MNKFTYTNKYGGSYENCEFLPGRYSNNNLGLEIWSANVGPVIKVTVNIDIKLPDEYIAIKNYSENEGMDKFMISMGLIEEDPASLVSSGYVIVPVYKLTDKGKEIFLSK